MLSSLNLDYFSIIHLATLIVSLSISVYLFSIQGKSTPTILLACAFFGAILFNLSMFLEHASPYYWQPYNLKNIIRPFILALGASIGVVSYLLFAYYFPHFQKEDRREFKIILIFAGLANLSTLGLTGYNSLILQRLQSHFQFDVIHFRILGSFIGIQFLLVIFLLIRKTIRLSEGENRSGWRKFVRPAIKAAKATRALALVLLLPLLAVVILVLRMFGFLPPIISKYLVWYVFLLFYFGSVITYLNYIEERTTFQVKLIGSALVVMLGIMGIVAVIIGKSYERDYVNKNLIRDHTTIHFEPNQYRSYNIKRAPFQFDSAMGLKTGISYDEIKNIDLKFSFPFFSRVHDQIHILGGPMIYLGEEIKENGWGGYHPQPVIAPVIMNLDPNAGGDIFLKSETESITITWYKIPEFDRNSTNTIQLVLCKDGSFDISYVELNPDLKNRSIKIDVLTTANITGTALGIEGRKGVSFEPRLIGIHPGGREVPLQPIRFMRDLPYSSNKTEAIFEAYDIDYYQYLHNRMTPFAAILLCSSFLILFFFPILFKNSLIKPLHMLYEGMEKADKGDLDVTITPQLNDEIGFLSQSFNRMLQSVKKAEGNFRTLAENAQDGILVLSENGIPVYANKSACDITGFCNSELMKINLNKLLPSDDLHKSGQKEGAILDHSESIIKTRNGEKLPVELTVSGIFWHGKSARVVVIRDITERKKNEEHTRQQQHRLMQMDKLTSLGILVAGVTHEINNPNQTILSNASFLVRACPMILSVLGNYGVDNEELLIAGLEYVEFRKSFPELIAGIEGCSNRIDGIVKNLKAFSRDEPQDFITSLEINTVIQTAVKLLENFIKKATENFFLELGSNIPKIRGNVQRLEQVIINLTLNACQSLTSREQVIAIRSFHDKKQNSIHITVHDEGRGIPEKHLTKIKDPFFTTKRSIGGTGLGLYVSESIVKEHNGILSFESSLGKGTVATISLPVEGVL